MRLAIYETAERDTSNDAYATSLKALGNRLRNVKRSVQLKLAGSSAGRIVLHVALAMMTCRFAWHIQGIARELTRS